MKNDLETVRSGFTEQYFSIREKTSMFRFPKKFDSVLVFTTKLYNSQISLILVSNARKNNFEFATVSCVKKMSRRSNLGGLTTENTKIIFQISILILNKLRK